MISEEEKKIVADCLAGRRDAQYLLYKKYSKPMYNVCLRMIPDQMEAEDILQNAFVDIFKRLDTFRLESTLGAWVKRVVVNQCINHIRGKKINFLSIDSLPDVIENENEEVQINVDVIKKAIGILPDGYRTIFCLYAMEGYDHGEIAEILSINENTSKSQYSRARSKLIEIIKSQGLMRKIYND